MFKVNRLMYISCIKYYSAIYDINVTTVVVISMAYTFIARNHKSIMILKESLVLAQMDSII